MLTFPVPPTFPQHDWSDNPVLPDFPVVVTKLLGGQTSDLRVSKIQNSGEFACEWTNLKLTELQTFIAFWGQVGLWDRFTLPDTFWADSCPAIRRDLFKALSPTGIWKFKDKPKWGDFGGTILTNPTVTIVLIGAID